MLIDPLIIGADGVDEAKTYVRIESDEEDGLISALLASAIRHCEGFTGQIQLTRGVVERLPVSAAWQRLSATPVQSISGVTGIAAEGASFALPITGYAIDIDGAGDGWVRVTQPGAAGRIDVAFTAGAASSWGAISDPLRHGILRLTAHLHANRDNVGDAGPPAAVAALWRPWRRMQLS
jgi:uncharacterized phiE125 gp8 family phage protein